MDNQWDVTLFGELKLKRRDGSNGRFVTQRSAALFAHLAYKLGADIPRDGITGWLWPDIGSDGLRSKLSHELSRLRPILYRADVPIDKLLIASKTKIKLAPEWYRTDVGEFVSQIHIAARVQCTSERICALNNAIEKYTGLFLPGFYYDWVSEAERYLEELYFQAATRLCLEYEKLGDVDRAIATMRKAVSVDKFREEFHRNLIRLLINAGKSTAAVSQYSALSKLLEKELRQAPNEATTALVIPLQAKPGIRKPPNPKITVAAPGLHIARTHTPPRESPGLPYGTVTVLLAEIMHSGDRPNQPNGSVSSISEAPFLQSASEVIAKQIRCCGGVVLSETQETVFAAFARPTDALACAVDSHCALTQLANSDPKHPIARIICHLGDVPRPQRMAYGTLIDEGRAFLVATHPGQIVCSAAVTSLLSRNLDFSHALVDLGTYRFHNLQAPERLFMTTYPGMTQTKFPPLRADPGIVSNLPVPANRYFGRADDQERLVGLLRDPAVRMVTLTGVGGIGKTRLSLEVARKMVDEYKGAVWLVRLAHIRHIGMIADAILTETKTPRTPNVDPFNQVVDVLNLQATLLVLDNFEQLVADGAPLVGQLLERVPGLKLLVSSRQLLNQQAEREHPVHPLPEPDETWTTDRLKDHDTIKLFLDRAQSIRPDFRLTGKNAHLLARLCAHLEGIPLAIELAAAGIHKQSLNTACRQLKSRLSLPTGGSRERPERHRTMRAAIDWSYNLLTPELKTAFETLAVFRGGWTLEAAETVCQDNLIFERLLELRQCSLIGAEEENGEMRLTMLETLREYADAHLSKTGRDAYSLRHAQLYLAVATDATLHLNGPDQVTYMRKIARELDNIRAATAWSFLSQQVLLHAQLVAAQFMPFYRSGHWDESLSAINNALDILQNEESDTRMLQASLLWDKASLAQDRGDLDGAKHDVENALKIYLEINGEDGEADSLILLGVIAVQTKHFDFARQCLENVIRRRPQDDHTRLGNAYTNLGILYKEDREAGDLDKAGQYMERALAEYRLGGNVDREASTLLNLGWLANHRKDTDRAEYLYKQSLELSYHLGNVPKVGMLLTNLAWSAYRRQSFPEALCFYHHAHRIVSRTRSKDMDDLDKLRIELENKLSDEFEQTKQLASLVDWQSHLNWANVPSY